MPRRKKGQPPAYRLHKQSGQAIVSLPLGGGEYHDVLLGTHGSEESEKEYLRVLTEWKAGIYQPGRRKTKAALSLAELMAAYLKYANQHYRREDGSQTKEVDEITRSLRPLNHLYGALSVTEFSPLKLKAIRQLLIDGYEHPKYGPQAALCRNLINQRMGRVVRMFKWSVSEELVPETVYNSLRTVSGLAKGRTEARESEPVEAVPDEVVEATLPFLLKPAAAMVSLQRVSGMRPGEVSTMRADEIDMSSDIWLYKPDLHKMRYRGKSRIVPLGPRAQEIVRPWLMVACPGCGTVERAIRIGWTGGLCGPCHDRREDGVLTSCIDDVEDPSQEYYLFVPRIGMELMWEEQRKHRKTKVQPSQACRKKKNPAREMKASYTSRSYLYAVHRAAKRARVEKWHPNQLRHTRASEIRATDGLEAAQVILGHSDARVSEIYAERDLRLAVEVARRSG